MKKGRLWALIGILAIVGALLYLVAGGLSQNMVFFLTPSELQARATTVYDEPLRLGGQVKPNSVDWNADAGSLRFVITDGSVEIPVKSTGAPPAMFSDQIGVVVEGEYRRDGVFHSTNVMVKHSNEYQPPKEGEHPKEIYRSLIRDET